MSKRAIPFGLIVGLLLLGAAFDRAVPSNSTAACWVDKLESKQSTLASIGAVVMVDAPEAQDTKLKELLKERIVIVRELTNVTNAEYQAGKVPFERVHQATQRQLHAQLEMCASEKDRITVLEEALALAKEYEKNALQRYKTGGAPQSDPLMATAARLEAEIALERAKTKVSTGSS